MKKKTEAQPAGPRPYFKCFPSDFLSGCIRLTPEEKAVYYTLVMLLYDGWETIDDSTVKQRGDLARFCGVSPRAFFVIRDRLLTMPEKLFRAQDGRLSNRRFERERAKLGSEVSDATPIYPPEKQVDKLEINGEINGPRSNDTKGLRVSRTRASPESIVQTVQNSVAEEGSEAEETAAQILESEISQICRALGVTLQASTQRHGWPYRWAQLRTLHDITVDDMVAAIHTFKGQINPETVRSLGLFKDRAVEKRIARRLNDKIIGRTREVQQQEQAHAIAEHSEIDWFEHLKFFLKRGGWITSKYGPSPVVPGCMAPPHLLDLAEAKWIEQGNHPECIHPGNADLPWKAGRNAPLIDEVTPFAPRVPK